MNDRRHIFSLDLKSLTPICLYNDFAASRYIELSAKQRFFAVLKARLLTAHAPNHVTCE